MPYPTISGYIDSVRDPQGLFRTLGAPLAERDFYGQPKVAVGGNAAVFRIDVLNGEYALKCFLRPVEHIAEVCRFLQQECHPLLCRSLHLPRELFVFDREGIGVGSGSSGSWHDVVIAEWAQGRTLDFEMRRAIHQKNSRRMASLADSFDRAVITLLEQEWAHGDLKPENIIVSPAGELRLIDYDSMYIPALAGRTSRQAGTPLWQHPHRSGHYFNRHIDDYSAALLSATLHCLASDISLHAKYGKGDIFLLDPAEIMDGRSKSYDFCMDAAAGSGNAPLYRLLDMLRSPTPHIEGLGRVIAAFGQNAGPVEQISAAQCRLSLFRENGAWGYKDDYGNVALAPLYDSGLEFSPHGTASVTLGKYRHMIDRWGKNVL